MLLIKNIFCAWILREFGFNIPINIPKEIIILIVSQIKVKIEVIDDTENILISCDKSMRIFDSATNKLNFSQVDWVKKCFNDCGTIYVITKNDKICRFNSGKFLHEETKFQQMYNFFDDNEIIGIKKVYCGCKNMKIILTECNQVITFKTGNYNNYFKIISLGLDESKIKKIALSRSLIVVLTLTNLHYFNRRSHPKSDNESVRKIMNISSPTIIKIKATDQDIYLLDAYGNVFISNMRNPYSTKIDICNIINIYCFDHYCFFLTKKRELYTYDNNENSELNKLEKIKLCNVMSVYMSDYRCIALTSDGKVHMWKKIDYNKYHVSAVPELIFQI